MSYFDKIVGFSTLLTLGVSLFVFISTMIDENRSRRRARELLADTKNQQLTAIKAIDGSLDSLLKAMDVSMQKNQRITRRDLNPFLDEISQQIRRLDVNISAVNETELSGVDRETLERFRSSQKRAKELLSETTSKFNEFVSNLNSIQ